MKVRTVPNKPNLLMLAKFSKNFFLLRLYPEAKMMRGKQTSRNTVPLNYSSFDLSSVAFAWTMVDMVMPITRMTPVSCPTIGFFFSKYRPRSV